MLTGNNFIYLSVCVSPRVWMHWINMCVAIYGTCLSTHIGGI